MVTKGQILAVVLLVICVIGYFLHDRDAGISIDISETRLSNVDHSDTEVVKPWAQFLGANGQGASAQSVVPVKWSNDQNLVWKTRLPGRGASTPIIVDDLVFLTAYTGYGIGPEEETAKSDLKLHLICLDRLSGKPNWVRTINGSPATQRPSENSLTHGSASSTPVCDGENVYAFFGVSGVFAFDVEGNFLWQADVGAGTDNFGSSASPTLYEDILIVNASIESKRVFGFNKSNGQPVWIIEDVERTWTTPVIGKSSMGRDELILSESFFVHGIDPKTGGKLWTCDGIQDYVVPLPVVDPNQDVVYCSGGKQSRVMAIRLGGSGDVSKTHKLWETRLIGNVPTPLLDRDQLHVLGENGVIQHFSTDDGKLLSKARVKIQGRVHASLVKSRDYFYVATPGLGVTVIDPNENYKTVAVNCPDPGSADCVSAVAISGNRLFYRTDDWLYCIGTQDSPTKNHNLDLALAGEPIVPRRKFEFDPLKGKPKTYVRYMTGTKEKTSALVLRPYDSVISPGAERASLMSLVGSHWEEYVSIRDEAKALLMNQNRVPEEEYLLSFVGIEERMNALDRTIRKKVRASFTPEQMKQHLEDHKRWVEARRQEAENLSR